MVMGGPWPRHPDPLFDCPGSSSDSDSGVTTFLRLEQFLCFLCFLWCFWVGRVQELLLPSTYSISQWQSNTQFVSCPNFFRRVGVLFSISSNFSISLCAGRVVSLVNGIRPTRTSGIPSVRHRELCTSAGVGAALPQTHSLTGRLRPCLAMTSS